MRKDLDALDPQLNMHLGEILKVLHGFKFHFFVDCHINITSLWRFIFRNAIMIQAPNGKFVVVTRGSSSLLSVSQLQSESVFYNMYQQVILSLAECDAACAHDLLLSSLLWG